jgi:hypothetical protein
LRSSAYRRDVDPVLRGQVIAIDGEHNRFLGIRKYHRFLTIRPASATLVRVEVEWVFQEPKIFRHFGVRQAIEGYESSAATVAGLVIFWRA